VTGVQTCALPISGQSVISTLLSPIISTLLLAVGAGIIILIVIKKIEKMI